LFPVNYLQEAADSSLVDGLVFGLPLLSCLGALKHISRYIPSIPFLGRSYFGWHSGLGERACDRRCGGHHLQGIRDTFQLL